MKILALDIGKYNSMCCLYDTATQHTSFCVAETKTLDQRINRTKNTIRSLFVNQGIEPTEAKDCTAATDYTRLRKHNAQHRSQAADGTSSHPTDSRRRSRSKTAQLSRKSPSQRSRPEASQTRSTPKTTVTAQKTGKRKAAAST